MELSKELLKVFYSQFAENQRTREQSFLKIISFLGAVVLGYAYVYKNYPQEEAFSYVALASIILLLAGATIVVIIAYNFRRDQYVTARINRQEKIIGDKKAFPNEFDPSHLFKDKESLKYFWMPDMFNAFFHIFPVFQLFILATYLHKLQVCISFSNFNCLVTIVTILSIISFCLSFTVLFIYSVKLRNKIVDWEDQYKKP